MRRVRSGSPYRWLWGVVAALELWLLGMSQGPAQAATTVVWAWSVEEPAFGQAVAGVGDVNGDGVPDVVIGASSAKPGGRSAAGSVFAFSGGDGQLLWRIDGEQAQAGLGYAVAGVGDVNGDGVPDVLVGAPDVSGHGAAGTGWVCVLSGVDGRMLWRVPGDRNNDRFGRAVAGVGDVNGDGVPDVLVGAPDAEPGGQYGAGSAYVLSGVDGRLLWRVDGERGFSLGRAVAGVGDVNGDGVPDVLVGAPAAGRVSVLSGGDGHLLWRVDWKPEYPWGDTYSDLGGAVAGAGDINGDGVPDIIASARAAGEIYVFSGRDGTVLRRFEWPRWESPDAVAGPGDVDGDGVPDILVGMDTADLEGRGVVGSAVVWSGADGRLLLRVDGARAGEQLGWAVAGVGDLNGDGRADIVVGAGFSYTVSVVSLTGPPPPAGVPVIGLDTRHLDFGVEGMRGGLTLGFHIRNDGGAPLTITAWGPLTPPFSLYSIELQPPFTLAPGQMELVYVSFVPPSPGRYRQRFVIRSDDPANPVVTVRLRGRGVDWGR